MSRPTYVAEADGKRGLLVADWGDGERHTVCDLTSHERARQLAKSLNRLSSDPPAWANSTPADFDVDAAMAEHEQARVCPLRRWWAELRRVFLGGVPV